MVTGITKAVKTVADVPAEKADPGSTAPGRVLVLLDGSRTSYAALAAAVAIAANTGADVLGVFVEELNLLRSSGFGFAREVGSASGVSRPLDANELEQRLHGLANQARRALASAVARYGGRQTLSIARGRVVDEVLALAEPQDLLVLGRVGWSSAPGARLGSTARGLVRRSPGRVLLWCDSGASPEGRVVVFLNDHEAANRSAIRATAEVVRHSHAPVTLLLASNSDLPAEGLQVINQALGLSERDVRVRSLPANDPATVARVLRQEKAVQLVLSRECALLREPGAEQLLALLKLPVTVTP